MSSSLPELIAFLNGLSLGLLIIGFYFIRSKKITLHRACMIAAVASSALFLVVYLIHHYQVGSVAYPHHDWTRTLYFIILIPHVILAAAMLPFIILALKHAINNDVARHKKIVRVTYPVWIFVSFTGLIVYFMLYRL